MSRARGRNRERGGRKGEGKKPAEQKLIKYKCNKIQIQKHIKYKCNKIQIQIQIQNNSNTTAIMRGLRKEGGWISGIYRGMCARV